MKHIFLFLLALVLISWQVEPKKYRVFKVTHKKGYWLVLFKQWHRPNYVKLKYECLPDTIYVGKTVYLWP